MHIVVLIAIWVAAFPALVFADANDELAACRRIIVQLGDDSEAPADQYCMGLSYAYGLNHKKDFAKAASWFRKAAEQNYAPAQSWLGFFQIPMAQPQTTYPHMKQRHRTLSTWGQMGLVGPGLVAAW